MLVKNLSPFPFGTFVTSRRPPRPEMVVVVRGKFDLVHGGVVTARKGVLAAADPPVHDPLAQGVLSGETYTESEDLALAAVVEPSDLVPFKLNAEVLVVGSCFAPNAKPVAECPVAVQVGEWSKGVTAVGRRAFSDAGPGAQLSKPIPFTEMKLGYDRCFGGPGFEANPSGLGIASDEGPNIEHPGQRTTRRGQFPALGPAGLGPLSAHWAHRAKKVGKNYGPEWKKTRAPWVSDDFDWTHHHAGPPDQQLKGFLKGDERVLLTNLHREHPTLETMLPALRIRAFAKDAGGTIREVPMALDTLVIRSDEGALTLTWRGLIEVAEDDLEDVATLLIASEPAAEPALSEAHYREKIAAFEADPLGAIAAVPPELTKLRDEGFAQLAAIEEAEASGRRGDRPPEEAIADRIAASLPLDDPRRAGLREQSLAALRELSRNLPPENDDLAKLAAPPAARVASPAPLRLPSRGEAPKAPPSKVLAQGLDRAIAQAKKAEEEIATHARHGAVPGGSAGSGPDAEKAREVVAHLEELRADPKMSLVFKPRVEPGPARDLSDHDLQEEDLRGANLEGANLEGTILTRADLRGANLRGARLSHAVLHQAILDDADLSGAALTLTQLTEAKGERVKLVGALIDRTLFGKARLPGADLSGLTGPHGLFEEVQLEGARFDGAKLLQCTFRGAGLASATFVAARLEGCAFLECTLTGARFERASLGGTSFMRSEVGGAIFTEASGNGVVFLEARLAGADFERSVLPGAQFGKAKAPGARFYGADLRGARFVRADLDGADFERSNLKDVDLRKAKLGRVSFRGASLFMATLLGASGKDADFAGANLKRCEIDAPR